MLVTIRAREKLRDLRGKVEFWDGYDYKAMRTDHPNRLPARKTKHEQERFSTARTERRRAA